MGGFQQGVLLESTLAVALTLRGARVDTLLCDSFLPACKLTEIDAVSPEDLLSMHSQPRCFTCHPAGKAMFSPLRLPIYWFSRLVPKEKRQMAQELSASIPSKQIGDYMLDGLAVGEHAKAGTLCYFGRGDLQNEPMAESILRHYLSAALRSGQTA